MQLTARIAAAFNLNCAGLALAISTSCLAAVPAVRSSARHSTYTPIFVCPVWSGKELAGFIVATKYDLPSCAGNYGPRTEYGQAGPVVRWPHLANGCGSWKMAHGGTEAESDAKKWSTDGGVSV